MTVRIEVYRSPNRRWCIFDCPKRPGHECKVMLKPWPVQGGMAWEVTGPEAAPTLHPSINCAGCGWHGFIRYGKTVPA